MYQPNKSLNDHKKQIILEAFKHHDRNLTTTSHALAIGLRTLRYLLRDYGVEPMPLSGALRKAVKRQHSNLDRMNTLYPDLTAELGEVKWGLDGV